MAPLAAELKVALDEVDGDVELGQEQGGGQTCGAAANDECAAGERLLGAEGEGVEAGHGAEAGDGHGDQGLGLGVEGAVVPLVVGIEHLLAEVGACQEAGVEAGIAHQVVELGSIEAVGAAGEHHAVEGGVADGLPDGVHALRGAGIGQGLCQGHAGQLAGPVEEPGDIEGARLAVAVADKDAGPGLLVRDVAKRLLFALLWTGLPTFLEKSGCIGGGAGGLGDRFRDILGLAEGAGEKDAGL